MPKRDVGDDVLLELGRLVWAAIELENVVYYVCRSIKPRHEYDSDVPIGRRIDEALSDLARCPADEMREFADQWLRAAKDALAERNAVLHSTPTIRVVPGGPPPDPDGTWLTHAPRKRDLPIVNTAVSLEGLEPLRRKLEDADEGWQKVLLHGWASNPRASRDDG